MYYTWLLLATFTALITSSLSLHRYPLHSVHQEKHHGPKNDGSWEFFMLVTEWPQSSCEYVNATHQHHQCVIPSIVKGWTLHGLWPSTNHGGDPAYCSHNKFIMEDVKDLESDLLKYWPNLYKESSESSFWKHEYEKHGTCAAVVPRFSNEHNFFQQTLELRNKYDPASLLEQHGISPREEGYKLTDVEQVLENAFGANVCIECSYISSRKQQLLSGLYICLSKEDQQPVDCQNCEHPCRHDEDLFYPPLHY